MWAVNIPATLRDDLVDTYGFDRAERELPNRSALRDAWNAVQFASPKGSGKHLAMRLNPALAPTLIALLEVRWADHFAALHSEQEAAYSRVIDDLRKRVASEARKGKRK